MVRPLGFLLSVVLHMLRNSSAGICTRMTDCICAAISSTDTRPSWSVSRKAKAGGARYNREFGFAFFWIGRRAFGEVDLGFVLPQPALVHGVEELVHRDETAAIRVEFLFCLR